MNHRNNRRSEATKNKIKQTLVNMLHTQNISKITVQALCEQASINRSTFYNHYESPLSVLANIEYEFVAKLETYLKEDICLECNLENLTGMLARILEFIQMNQNVCFLQHRQRRQRMVQRQMKNTYDKWKKQELAEESEDEDC